MKYDYDLFIIGAGSGGLSIARRAAQTGAKVAIAEEFKIGGTCVIRGCIPKKQMVYASKFKTYEKDSARYGVSSAVTSDFSWSVLRDFLSTTAAKSSKRFYKTLKENDVTVYKYHARLKAQNTVVLDSDITQEITAKHIVIATGGTPYKPNIEGAEYAIDSNQVFLLDKWPQKILIVGGGYIALEMAFIFKGLGVDTQISLRGNTLLRNFDSMLQYSVTKSLESMKINMRLSVTPEKIVKVESGGLKVTFTDGSVDEFCQVLYAIGRTPNTLGLGLEKVGVNTGTKGEILVDDYSQTNIKGIFAVGDVTDRINLTPVAIDDGIALVNTLYNNKPTKIDHTCVATAVFSQPEIGTVGLSLEDARARYQRVDLYESKFVPLYYTGVVEAAKSVIRVVVDASNQQILGVHIFGDGAAEIIQSVAIAVKMGATKSDFDNVMAVHPTSAEELVLLRSLTKSYSS